MDIREIMRSNSSSQQFFLVNAQDLKNAIDASIQQVIQELNEDVSKSNNDNLVPLKEVAETLNVSRCTLNRWNKDGYLVPIKIGRKVFYRQNDINKIR
jgi:DNA-binding transcriptional MerR regulator|nr:MAG TPA: helix-turn-helix domain protein [Bacteriophage sp.]DAZ04136.1 MAG TPA: helix-turn-helix domain protein [Caudoviricetes sp.]